MMASFERVLMPGLEKISTASCGWSTRTRDGFELNFVIPNMELQSGKRLQPYYDRADRPRMDARQPWLITITGCMSPTPRRTAG